MWGCHSALCLLPPALNTERQATVKFVKGHLMHSRGQYLMHSGGQYLMHSGGQYVMQCGVQYLMHSGAVPHAVIHA